MSSSGTVKTTLTSCASFVCELLVPASCVVVTLKFDVTHRVLYIVKTYLLFFGF